MGGTVFPDRIGGGWSGARVSIICLLLSCQALEAHASPKRNRTRRQRSNIWDDDPELNSYTTHLTDLAWPILQNLGFSGAVGLVCAVALKVALNQRFTAHHDTGTTGKVCRFAFLLLSC